MRVDSGQGAYEMDHLRRAGRSPLAARLGTRTAEGREQVQWSATLIAERREGVAHEREAPAWKRKSVDQAREASGEEGLGR